MDLNQKEIVVSEGKRPFWQTIIAAFLFCCTIFLIFYIFYLLFMTGADPKGIKAVTGLIQMSIYAFMTGLSFSVVKTIYINIEKEKLKTEYSVGIFKISKYSQIPQLEYISVYRNPRDIIEVNLWYKGNKHYNVFNFDDLETAHNFGLAFSNKLNIDLLDATQKGNSKWVIK
jgi:hypothetical protein